MCIVCIVHVLYFSCEVCSLRDMQTTLVVLHSVATTAHDCLVFLTAVLHYTPLPLSTGGLRQCGLRPRVGQGYFLGRHVRGSGSDHEYALFPHSGGQR